jgi:hypothetical protein
MIDQQLGTVVIGGSQAARSAPAYPTKDEAANYLENARAFELPVRTGVKVDRLAKTWDRFEVRCGQHTLFAENVVVATGGLLLLEEQDRSLWDREHMRLGAEWLQRSATGDVFSRFHAEAGIAAEHCFAPSFEATRWHHIADLYAMLERIDPSPLHTLNRAIAIAESQGPAAGLALLQAIAPPPWLAGSYLWDAVMGDLHRRAVTRRSPSDIASARWSQRRPTLSATFSGAAWRSRPDSALRRSHLQRSCECVPSSASARFEIRPVIV